MNLQESSDITSVLGQIPYRMALAGGWIDQPFISRLNPSPPGSMVVVSLEPTFRFMDRCGMATSTRDVANKLWNGTLPARDPMELMRELYYAENRGKPEPSGSQDMAGLVLPCVSRLDYDYAYEGGYFPVSVESDQDPDTALWLEDVIHILPVAQRPDGYSPLGVKHLDPEWVRRLGQSGEHCFDSIISKDINRLGDSMNECMESWEALLPHTVAHPAISVDLLGILRYYQSRYRGAMYSGCGGGYLFVASEERVPGSFHATIRVSRQP